MDRKLIIDKEVNLNDCDYLKTKVYADNLTDVIKNTENDRVFTIGLFGSWGTGKSSIIETTKQEIEKSNDNIKFITYDAWQYVNDSFRRMFLRKLREDLKYEETDLMKKFYENESTNIGNKYKLSSTRLSFILGGLIVLLAILTFVPFDLEYKFPVYSIFTLLGLLITIISGAFHQLKISITKPHLFAPEQFEECFNEIVLNALKKSKVVLKWVKGDKSIQNLEKLVIVIDNIDRCSNDNAYRLLTDIKTFLSSKPYSIVFVIPVDDIALRKHIINSNKILDDCDKDKEEFLRKFFNVTIRIKPYGETDMFAFAKQISDKYNLYFKPDTINIASKEYAKNPRRVIQLFNNLLVELNYYDPEFAERNETLVCCVIIIREEYPDYYENIINCPKLFIDANVSLINDSKDYKNKDELNRFIRITQKVLENSKLEDLCKILTNSYSQFDDISSDIKDSIQSFSTEKVLASWYSIKERIVDYIVDKLENAIKNELVNTDLVNYFGLVVEINKHYVLDKHWAKRIDEKIELYLSTIIERTYNHENLCYYAYNRNNQDDNTIKKTLIEGSIRSKNQEKGNHWQYLFAAVLKVFNDKDTSIALSSTYTEYSQFVENNDFSIDQFNHLISNEYVQQKITELARIEANNNTLFDTNTAEYQKVKWLFENKQNIDESTYGHFFTHIMGENMDNSKMIGKTIDDVAGILKFVNPLLNFIPDEKLKTQPQTLYDLIVNDRLSAPKPQYANNNNVLTNAQYYNPQHYNTGNFIDECINAEKYIAEIICFVFNIYRITNCNTSTKNEMEKLIKKYSLDEEFIALINKKYTLVPILDLIFDDDENYEPKSSFENDKRLFLLKHCFNQKTNNKYEISEDRAKTKLDELLIFAQMEKSEKVFDLLESLITHERYKIFLSDLIIVKDSDFINSLPQKFLKFAIGTFGKDNFINFADNFNFLKVIIQHGNNKQKSYVITILTSKLDNNENIEQCLNLIDVIENISSFDKSGLLHSHLDNCLHQNKDSIDDELKEKLEKQLKNIKKNT